MAKSSSALDAAGNPSPLSKTGRPGLRNEMHNFSDQIAALCRQYDTSSSHDERFLPLNRWFDGNKDPFAVAVEQEIQDGAAYIARLLSLETTMRMDADRIIGSKEVLFGTVF